MTTPQRVVLITAAAGAGIGAAVARRFARDGYHVVVTDAHERRAKELADQLREEHEGGASAIPLDVTDHAAVAGAVDQVAAEHGHIDVLVNNAGWNRIEPIAEMDVETWQQCLDVDLTGTFVCLRHVLPHMYERGSGAVVNITSIAGWECSTEHGAAYSAAKAGVMALTRVAAAESGRHGVRVNAIAPGLIYNEFLRRIYPDSFFEGYAQDRSLVGRVGEPEDVANLVAFLASDEAGYVTGEVYGVSGGVLPHA